MQPRHVKQGRENMAGAKMKESNCGCSAQKEIGFQPTNPLETFFLVPREAALRWWWVRLLPFTVLPARLQNQLRAFFTSTTNEGLPFPTVRKIPLPKLILASKILPPSLAMISGFCAAAKGIKMCKCATPRADLSTAWLAKSDYEGGELTNNLGNGTKLIWNREVWGLLPHF